MEEGTWGGWVEFTVYGLSDPGDVYITLSRSVSNKDEEREFKCLLILTLRALIQENGALGWRPGQRARPYKNRHLVAPGLKFSAWDQLYVLSTF